MIKLSNIAKMLGSRGGKKSVQVRFAGKSKKEISEIMRKVRYSKKGLKIINEISKEFVDGLNKGMK